MTKKKVSLSEMKCPVCGEIFIPKTKRVQTCSRSCGTKLGNTESAREKARQTKIERYGDPNYNNRDKVKADLQAKYGEHITNAAQVPETKAKIVKTYTERHGGMGMASKSASKKTLETTKKKYGVENDDSITNIYQIKEVKDKIRNSNGGKWGTLEFGSGKSSEQSKSILKDNIHENENIYKDSLLAKVLMSKYGLTSLMLTPESKEASEDLSQLNRLNETWQLFIKNETGIQFEYEGKVYGDNFKKVDLFHEELKLAIEINPTITHTTQPSIFTNEKVSVKYHQDRATLAEENGWNLIQVFDWDNPDDIIQLIKSVANVNYKSIYARKCEVKEIPIEMADKFAKENHRQGSKAIGNIAYGLFYKDDLVQIQSYAKERFVKNKDGNYELIRMCSKNGIRVVGGASKLMSAFVNSDYQPTRIKTFVDYAKGQGKTYEKMGMTYIGLANLNGHYANINTGEAYKVSSVSSKFKKEYDELGQTQQQFMNSKGFYRINDAGNKIFEWVKNINN